MWARVSKGHEQLCFCSFLVNKGIPAFVSFSSSFCSSFCSSFVIVWHVQNLAVLKHLVDSAVPLQAVCCLQYTLI